MNAKSTQHIPSWLLYWSSSSRVRASAFRGQRSASRNSRASSRDGAGEINR